MVHGSGQFLQPVVTNALKQGAKYLEYALAGGIGTTIGIGNNPEIRELYYRWRGKTRYTTWQDRYVRRRFKGDVLVENDYTEQETYSPNLPERHYTRRGVNNKRRFRYRRSTNYPHHHKRRCYCKGRMGRDVVKQRQRHFGRQFYSGIL